MIPRCRSAPALFALALFATACGDGTGTGTGTGDDVVRIVATTSIWADITSAALCGVDVPAIVPAGADPHTFEPSLRDREMLARAEVVVANGGGLEGPLGDLLSTVENTGTDVIEVAPSLDPIPAVGDEIDPHVWQDPRRVIDSLDVVTDATGSIGLTDCADTYRRQLLELDEEIEELLADIPAARRVLVTSHDSLAYFAERYGLEIVGTVIPSTNTLAETNAADLADLADLIETRGVRVIFTEQLESTVDADALANRLGIRVVPLVTDALTADADSDTYVEMMRTNATRIAEELTP